MVFSTGSNTWNLCSMGGPGDRDAPRFKNLVGALYLEGFQQRTRNLGLGNILVTTVENERI